jgi:hypothetical protein
MVKKQDKHTQIEKFREAARELETDDSEEAFDAKLKNIAKAPPPQNGSKGKDGGDKV